MTITISQQALNDLFQETVERSQHPDPDDPLTVHEAFFQREFAQISVERYQLKRIIYDPIKEVIVQWIN